LLLTLAECSFYLPQTSSADLSLQQSTQTQFQSASQSFTDLVRTGIPSPLSSDFPQEIPPRILHINRQNSGQDLSILNPGFSEVCKGQNRSSGFSVPIN
jgi:hypothetical protein